MFKNENDHENENENDIQIKQSVINNMNNNMNNTNHYKNGNNSNMTIGSISENELKIDIDIWFFDIMEPYQYYFDKIMNNKSENIKSQKLFDDIHYKQYWVVKHFFYFTQLETVWNIACDIDEYLYIKSSIYHEKTIYDRLQMIQEKHTTKHFIFKIFRQAVDTQFCFNYDNSINDSNINSIGSTFLTRMIIRYKKKRPHSMRPKLMYATENSLKLFRAIWIHDAVLKGKLKPIIQTQSNSIIRFLHFRNFYKQSQTCNVVFSYKQKSKFNATGYCVQNKLLLPDSLNPGSLYPPKIELLGSIRAC